MGISLQRQNQEKIQASREAIREKGQSKQGAKSSFLLRLFLSRLLRLLITLLLVYVLTFLVFYVLPGDPARIMLGPQASEAKVQALRISLGLDRPLGEQFLTYLYNLFRGDLGQSQRFMLPVASLLFSRLSLSFALAMMALIFRIIIGLPLALGLAYWRKTWLDRLVLFLSRVGLAFPPFFLAICLSLLAAVMFRDFAVVQYVPFTQNVWQAISSLFWPAIALAIPRLAWVLQFLHQALEEQASLGYLRTARGKGLSPWRILWRHLLPNALVPLVTVLGLVLAELLAGAVLIEQVYNLPGLGRLLVVAAEARDYPLLMGLILSVATFIVLVSALVDLLNQWIDPRLRRWRTL